MALPTGGDGSANERPAAAMAPPTVGDGSADDDRPPWEYSLRKYLLLLATLVANVTYTAGFTPPGGVWEETDPVTGHLAGDPIIRHTSYARYVVFFYSNATAFGSSLVVIVLILILSVRHEMRCDSLGPVAVLRGFMVLDLLSLMVAYSAGIYRDGDVPEYTMGLAALTVVYVVVFHVVLAWEKKNKEHDVASRLDDGKTTTGESSKWPHILVKAALFLRRPEKKSPSGSELEKDRKVLMLLATFAASVTYLAGFNVPGGFWNHAGDGHRPGEPVLMGGRHEARLKAFVQFNSTAFFWSLLITVQLLDKNLGMRTEADVRSFRFRLLYTSIVLALLGLIGAYSTGSSWDTDTTICVTLIVGAVPVCILLVQGVILLNKRKTGKNNRKDGAGAGQTNDSDAQPAPPEKDDRKDKATPQTDNSCAQRAPEKDHRKERPCICRPAPWKFCSPCCGQINQTGDSDKKQALEKARSLVLLLATLAATITYQAGLDPPGGLWEDGGVGHNAGDPILLTTNPRRYKTFFYCNSVAFVASLVAIILVKKRILLQYHALEAAMILDLFGLIGAYAAGSCRDVSTSIYAMALAGAVLVYVVIHVVFFTLDHGTVMNDEALEVVEKRRKRLLLFAILAATITYQAGLTPPGGFRLQDDRFGGHLAGDPVLLYNFPRRYGAFFYCNSVSFMLSIALILLLVNPNLYRPAIKSHALSVCTAAGMFSLVGAYAAGSTQHLETSIKIFGLVAAILFVVVLVVLVFIIRLKKSDVGNKTEMTSKEKEQKDEKKQELHSKRKYLMLLGILGASVTYQAGLKPPGGVWQAHGISHVAGNPVMYDKARTRYLAFFYINSTSFVASIIVIILLLLKPLHKGKLLNWLLRAMNITILLDLLGLLVAYAVGSTRSWKATGYVFALVVAVLSYIAIHIMLSWLIGRDNVAPSKDEEKM